MIRRKLWIVGGASIACALAGVVGIVLTSPHGQRAVATSAAAPAEAPAQASPADAEPGGEVAQAESEAAPAPAAVITPAIQMALDRSRIMDIPQFLLRASAAKELTPQARAAAGKYEGSIAVTADGNTDRKLDLQLELASPSADEAHLKFTMSEAGRTLMTVQSNSHRAWMEHSIAPGAFVVKASQRLFLLLVPVDSGTQYVGHAFEAQGDGTSRLFGSVNMHKI